MRISRRSSERANCPKTQSRTMMERMTLFIVDDDDVIGQPVGDIELLLVSGKGQSPWPFADQHIIENFAACDIDNSDVIGAAESDIGARSIPGHHEIDRRYLLLSHSLGKKLDRAGNFEAREVDDVRDAPDLAG